MGDIKLSGQQVAVIDSIEAGFHVLTTGPAGTGKSALLNFLRERYGKRLCVTASTGIAALNVGGSTLHSFAGLIPGDYTAEEIAERHFGNKGRAFKNITTCEYLAIDEISMISGELLDTLNTVFKLLRRNGCPFGGVQLILFGDFFQLPPVAKKGVTASFAFKSKAWAEAGVVTHLLTKVYRQADQAFADGLGRLRVGDINHPSIKMFASRQGIPLPNDGIQPVIIHSHNAEVDRLNHLELAKLETDEFTYEAVDKGKPQAIQQLDRDCLAPRVLRLRKGAQVMLLSNLDIENGLVNGSLGVVTRLDAKTVVVKFLGRALPLIIEVKSWSIGPNGTKDASREQYPLRLAYAITSHKVQGMTLDRILCYLGDSFEFGQAYTSVSRVKTLDGLFLRNSTRKAFRAHPDAVAFYKAAEAQNNIAA